jgi:hypothetical protein
LATGLTLLQGCTDLDVLAWNETTDAWTCTSVSGTGGVTGTGTNGYNAYWTGTSTLGSEQFVNVSRGGTGLSGSSAANGTLLIGNGSGYTLATLTDGTGITITEGAGSITIASTLGTSVDLASEVTGTLPVANGGTGATTFTANGLLYGNTTGALQVTAAGTSAQFLVANGSGVPTFVSMSSDATIANTGALTIAADAVALSTDTTGNYVATITNGSGITGSSASEGGTPTIALGALTADWNQTGAFDIALNNAGSELKILESAGATYYGIFDVTDLAADRTYTFPDASGTVALTSDLHSAVTVSGAYDYITLVGQDIVRGQIDLTTDVTGTLPVGNGGTNKALTLAAGAIVWTDADSFEVSAVGTAGQALISGGAGTPTWFAPTAGSIIFAGTSGILEQDNANFFYDNTTNRLGLGDATPDAVLDLNFSSTNATAGTEYGATVIVADTGNVGSGTDNTIGTYTTVSRTGASAGTFNTYGNYASVTGSTVGTSTATGFYGTASGADTNYGFRAVMSDASSTTNYGIHVDASDVSGGSTIYGVYSQVSSQAAGTAYGLYVDAGAGAGTEYAGIFMNGNVGIGDAAPAALFTVGDGDDFQINTTGAITAATGITSSGTITFSGLSTAGIVTNTAAGVLGTTISVPIANGGTNATTIGSAGSIAYSTGTAYAFSAVGSAGQALVSGGAGAPTFFAPTLGSVVFATTSGALAQDNANFFWDDTNNRLGLGTTSPAAQLSIFGTTNALRLSYDVSNYASLSASSTGTLDIVTSAAGESVLMLGDTGSANDTSVKYRNSAQTYYAGLDGATSDFMIGTGVTVGSSALFDLTNTGALTLTGTALTTTDQLTLNANTLTTGYAQQINVNGSTALTTGGAIDIDGPTGAATMDATTGLVNISSTGALTNSTTGAASGTLFQVTGNGSITPTLASISNTSVMTTTGKLLDLTANAATTVTGLQTINATGLTTGYAMDLNVNGAAVLTSGGAINIDGPTGTAAQGAGALLKITSTGATTGTAGSGNLLQLSTATVTGTAASITDAATMTTTGNLLTLTANAATTAAGILRISTNALTSGNAFTIASSSAAMTGALQSITLSGSNAANTGNLLLIADTGVLNTTTPFKVTGAGAATQVVALIENTGAGTSFRVNDEASDTTPFVIDAAGNVGIGTTAPTTMFELYGTGSADAIATLTAPDATYDPIMKFRTAASPAVQFTLGVDNSDSDKFKIYSGDGLGSGDEFVIDSNGVTTIANLNLGATSFDEDAGAVTWVDMSVTSGATVGTVESYTAQLDGNAMLTIYGTSDGAGSVADLGVGIMDMTPDGALDFDQSSASTTAATTYGGNFTVSDTGIVTTGTDTTYGTSTSVTRTGATGGTINTYGQYTSVTADNAGAGTSTAYGIYAAVSGADTNYSGIFTGGNFGIGDATPDNPLEITSTSQQLRLSYTDGSVDGVIAVDSNEYLTLQAGTTSEINRVQIGAGGAGNTTPDFFSLDVKSDTGDPAGGFEGAMYYNTFDNKFRCYQNAAWTDCIGTGGTVPADSLDFIDFEDILDLDAALTLNQTTNTWSQTFTGDTTTGLTYTANSLTSGKALAIASSATAFTGNLQNITLSGSNAANTGSLLAIDNTGTLNTNTSLYIKHYATGTNNLAFRVDDVSGDTSPFVIDGAGNVGIGTATPAAMLDIYGTANAFRLSYDGSNYASLTTASDGTLNLSSSNVSESQFVIGNGSAVDSSIGFDGSAQDYYAGLDHTTGFFTIGTGFTVGSSTLLAIDSTGNVGIGATTPAYRLDVYDDVASNYVGNFFNDGNNANRYGIQIQGGADDGSGTTYYINALDGDGGQVGYIANTSGTFALTDVSDERTKANIDDTRFSDATSIINELRVVDYNRKSNIDGPLITGFVAQEVLDVYPNAVTVGPDGLYGIMKDAFIPLLVKGFQEEDARLTIVEEQISQISLQTTANVSTLAGLQVAVDDQLVVAGNALNTLSAKDVEIDAKLVEYDTYFANDLARLDMLDTLTAGFGTSLADQVGKTALLESQVATLTEQVSTLAEFYTTFDMGSFIAADVDGNVSVAGILKAKIVESEGLVIEVADAEAPTIGTAEIFPEAIDADNDGNDDYTDLPMTDAAVLARNGKQVDVLTKAMIPMVNGSRIFTTFKDNPSAFSWIEKLRDENDDYIGFRIHVSEKVTSKVKVDWLLIEQKDTFTP